MLAVLMMFVMGEGKNGFTGTDGARIPRGSGSGAPAARVEMTMIGRKVMMMMMMECMFSLVFLRSENVELL